MKRKGSRKTSPRAARKRPGKRASARSSSPTVGRSSAPTVERSSSTVKSTPTMAALRDQVAKALAWHDASAGFDKAIEGVPPELRGRRPEGLPYSLWQLLEHMRMAQYDILDFCRNAKYVEAKWPDDYWPKTEAPPTQAAWDASIAAFRRDREAMQKLVIDLEVDLFAKIPHGSGQTYLREALLVIDHNAHHIGQLIVVRRLLAAWPE